MRTGLAVCSAAAAATLPLATSCVPVRPWAPRTTMLASCSSADWTMRCQIESPRSATDWASKPHVRARRAPSSAILRASRSMLCSRPPGVLGVLANGIEANGSQTVRTIADRPVRNCSARLPNRRLGVLEAVVGE